MARAATAMNRNVRLAIRRWGRLPGTAVAALKELSREYRLSVALGDLLYFNNCWYVSHSGLLRIAQRSGCCGIKVECVEEFSAPALTRWAFKATVYRSHACRGFVGYGDADPSNVSSQVRGAEMRVAETRAVNRALRKAYGIGLCSVEELGANVRSDQDANGRGKLPPQTSRAIGLGGRKVRDQLCQIIRQHQLDPNLVKAYAIDFCGVETLKDATREQVETFVKELSEWAERDRNALLCQLNSYLGSKEGAA